MCIFWWITPEAGNTGLANAPCIASVRWSAVRPPSERSQLWDVSSCYRAVTASFSLLPQEAVNPNCKQIEWQFFSPRCFNVGQTGRWNLWWAPAGLGSVIMLALFTGSSRHLAGKGVGWTGASPKHFGDDFIRRSFQKLCQMKSLSWSNNILILNKTILTLVCPSLCWFEEGSMRWNSCRVVILFLWHNPHKDQWFSEWPMRTIFLFRADKFGTLRTNKKNMSWIWRWQFDILNPNLLNPPLSYYEEIHNTSNQQFGLQQANEKVLQKKSWSQWIEKGRTNVQADSRGLEIRNRKPL